MEKRREVLTTGAALSVEISEEILVVRGNAFGR